MPQLLSVALLPVSVLLLLERSRPMPHQVLEFAMLPVTVLLLLEDHRQMP